MAADQMSGVQDDATEPATAGNGDSPTSADPVRVDAREASSFISEAGTPAQTLRALRAVLLRTMQDAFDLIGPEVMWTSYQLEPVMGTLEGRDPVGVPASVRQELLHGTYSDELNLAHMDTREASSAVYHGDVVNADLTEWAGALTNLIRTTYKLRPLEEETIRGLLTGILRELGVGDEVDPRGAVYLPSTVLDEMERRNR